MTKGNMTEQDTAEHNLSDKEKARILQAKGWGVIPPDQFQIDIEPDFLRIWEKVRPFTMTYLERGYALYKAVEYVCRQEIPGDFVECGVWKGGSCMLIAYTLKKYNQSDRRLFLYDTFSGMTEPTAEDVIAWNDRSVLEKWEEDKSGRKNNFTSWSVGLAEVKRNLFNTGYPSDLLTFVEGDILETLKANRPERIALLRLDTDWYQSTAFELETLYPLLVRGGVLVIDDYGHFKGARKAVDEYFAGLKSFPLLARVDYTGRIGVKND